MYLSAGQRSDYIGARALLVSLPLSGAMFADRGYDADWYRNALIERDIQPGILSKRNRKIGVPHDADLHRKRHKVENMFARVISPFLTGCIRRIHAAIFNFMAGVMPPMPMLGRSLL